MIKKMKEGPKPNAIPRIWRVTIQRHENSFLTWASRNNSNMNNFPGWWEPCDNMKIVHEVGDMAKIS